MLLLSRVTISNNHRHMPVCYYLKRCEMDHVVSRLFRDPQFVLPSGERAQALRDNRLTLDAVQGERVVSRTDREARVDQEVALTTAFFSRW